VAGAEFCLGNAPDQGMAGIDLQYGFATDAPLLQRQQSLQLAIGALTAGYQASGAIDQAVRGTHFRYTLADHPLDRGNDDRRVDGGWRRLSVGGFDGRALTEVDVALAQRFQGFVRKGQRQRGPKSIDRIGKQQNFDVSSARSLQLRI